MHPYEACGLLNRQGNPRKAAIYIVRSIAIQAFEESIKKSNTSYFSKTIIIATRFIDPGEGKKHVAKAKQLTELVNIKRRWYNLRGTSDGLMYRGNNLWVKGQMHNDGHLCTTCNIIPSYTYNKLLSVSNP